MIYVSIRIADKWSLLHCYDKRIMPKAHCALLHDCNSRPVAARQVVAYSLEYCIYHRKRLRWRWFFKGTCSDQF